MSLIKQHLYYQQLVEDPMKCEVQLFVSGTVFKEEVYARDYEAAKKVALARNPGATVVSVTAKP